MSYYFDNSMFSTPYFNSYQYEYPTYANLFSQMPVVPSLSVFDNNIFGFTPPDGYYGANPFSQQYMSPINLTNPFMTYNSTPKTIVTSNIFGFLRNSSSSTSQTSSSQSSSNIFGFLNATTTLTYLPSLQNSGYNSQKAQNLTNAILSVSPQRWGDELCARHVKNAISQAGLGKYQNGNAYQMIEQLRKNPNFKEISTAGLNLSNLPKGCILVYDRGVSGYSSQYGHVEITVGNGKALSSGITQDIKQGAKVFIPV